MSRSRKDKNIIQHILKKAKVKNQCKSFEVRLKCTDTALSLIGFIF